MFGAIFGGVFGAIAKWLLGKFFGNKEPTEADRAAEAATAETQLASKETANVIESEAAAARADAANRVVRSLTDSSGDANAALRKQFPDDFRD